MPKPNKHKLKPEQMHAEARRLLLMGYTFPEVGEQLGVAHNTVRHWKRHGKFEMPTKEEIAAWKAEHPNHDLGHRGPGPAPKLKNIPFDVPEIKPAHVRDEVAKRQKEGGFAQSVREDFEFFYTRLALAFRTIVLSDEIGAIDPTALMNWGKVLDQMATKVEKIDAELGTQDEPEDAVAQRQQLAQRRERLAAQYQKASGGEDLTQ